MNDREAVALGALLLDIGKFWQRTNEDTDRFHEYAPGKKPGGSHVPWSALFLRTFVAPHFPNHAAKLLEGSLYQDRLALDGHPDESTADRLSRTILIARNLASEQKTDSPAAQGDQHRLQALTDLVAYSEEGKKARDSRHYYPVVPLSLSETVFPKAAQDSNPVATEDYARLWKAFIVEYDHLPRRDFGTYFDSIVYLLHKYTWCIPGAPFASIYDVSRVSAALAVCLYDASSAEASTPEEFLFIEGDLSGIQEFIYNPTFNGQELQDGMARRLRGRSFYLSLLINTLADYVATKLGLLGLNILWSSGGHFLMIAPNTRDTVERLEQSRTRIRRWIWEEFRGALGIIISYTAASGKEISDFRAIKERLGLNTSAAKLQQHLMPLSLPSGYQDQVWQSPWVLRMGMGICRDTGRDLSDEDIEISSRGQNPPDEGGPVPDRSHQSMLFDCIGRVLVKAQTVQLRRAKDWELAGEPIARSPRSVREAGRLRHPGGRLLIEFGDLDRVWLLTDASHPEPGADLSFSIVDNRNPAIDFLGERGTSARGFQMFADAVRLDGEHIVDFHDLAEAAEGANFLGVLRMDVDNLGHIFADGLPTGHRSIVDTAALSRGMDWFFAGFINTLVREKNLYTTYGGGDDLFIVGAWNEAVEAANHIQTAFRTFCGENPDLHISGAIALCKGKYPIGRAAEQSGDLLNTVAKAKRDVNIQHDTDKDALAFLERKVPWIHWTDASELVGTLVSEIESPEKKVSRKFVHNLLDIYRLFIDPDRDPSKDWQAPHIRWVALFKYSVVRNVQDAKLRTTLLNSIPRLQHYLSVLAGYVALLTRTREKEKDIRS